MSLPWDHNLSWRTELVSVDALFMPLATQYVMDKVLRVRNDGEDSDFVEGLIRTAVELYEYETGNSLRPQTLRLYLSGYPCGGEIRLPGGPVRSVESISYYDSSNESQTYGGSPVSYVLVTGGRYGQAAVQIGVNETWPSTACRLDAVTVEYETGYESADDIPASVLTGIGLCVAELYKNRELTSDGTVAKNLLSLERFWPKRY